MSQKHAIRAWAPWGLDSDAIPVRITYAYTRGRPAVMYLRNGDPGYPAESAEAEFISVEHEQEGLTIPAEMQQKLDAWAIEWLANDDGYARAIEEAESREDEDLYDRMMEERRGK